MFRTLLVNKAMKIQEVSMQGNIGTTYSFQNKLAFDRMFPFIKEPESISLNIHQRINHRYVNKLCSAQEAMDCDWYCTSKYWRKAYDNIPKQDLNGPFNTSLISKQIRL